MVLLMQHYMSARTVLATRANEYAANAAGSAMLRAAQCMAAAWHARALYYSA